MSLSDDDIQHIARLSALSLNADEAGKLKNEINDILSYVEKLSSVTTRGVVATSHVHGAVNAFRDDVIKDSLSVEEALKNSADVSRGGFRVPRIIG